ncbi:pep-cterm sorting domain-containing protein [Anaeramoeba ignava]|uniref:Pep-cterm sorting domain-containing protein n=1 Tax=Anaeramoeba ignava TaxID=1746090 RepID=A0A9Q0LFC6_ANAIG|nr:pep-cterm sorting domain-containing protein [Anaeramoeba ignava]
METYSNLEKLSNDLQNLFQNQKEEDYFDFEVVCQQNEETQPISFKTHKSILSSRSEYFKNFFNSKIKDLEENKMILLGVSSGSVYSILNYLYSGKIEMSLQNAVEILHFSTRFSINEVIEIASNYIQKNLQIANVVDVLNLSESMNFNQLIELCYQFISTHFDEFIQTPFFLQLEERHLVFILSQDDIKTNEFTIFNSLISWGKHKLNINKTNLRLDNKEKEALQNQISNAIHKIRFIDISSDNLDTALKQGLIPRDVSQKIIEFQNINSLKSGNKLNEFLRNHQEETKSINSLIFQSRIQFNSQIIKEREHFNKLKEWIKDDDFFSRMRLGFSAKRDGFTGTKWHDICDDKGKTLVVIKTTDNYIFGGFTQVGWSKGPNRWIQDSDSFLFSLKNPKLDPPQKLPISNPRESKFALHYHALYGPIFGYGHDLILHSDLQPGFSNIGHSYDPPKGIKSETTEAENYLAGSYSNWKF